MIDASTLALGGAVYIVAGIVRGTLWSWLGPHVQPSAVDGDSGEFDRGYDAGWGDAWLEIEKEQSREQEPEYPAARGDLTEDEPTGKHAAAEVTVVPGIPGGVVIPLVPDGGDAA